MALHGEVKINGDEIVRWYARRKTKLRNFLTPDMEKHNYECWVAWPETTQGFEHRVDFELEHRYGEGAEVLLAAIMTTAAPMRLSKIPATGEHQ